MTGLIAALRKIMFVELGHAYVSDDPFSESEPRLVESILDDHDIISVSAATKHSLVLTKKVLFYI